ncbi:hypothetical protein [Qipengyuania gaetbuli]|uniref:hypothetical protein n=1 Tax=Qipengyuania gaetbuli TaxID=266952 RepID=UPI001CD32A4B|nr:hypothetical protein [Qipengyuania gaetbuli]MCA0909570.1 hypothetical protein [Qipengyuania gaetbuli]
MQRISLSIVPHGEDHALEFDALDIAAALMIADINAAEGPAELREGTRHIATLRRRGSGGAVFWEVS